MNKKAVSVTLRPDNLLWLKTRVKATGGRSLSESLDEIIMEARVGAGSSARTIRSVVGNARIPRSDAALSEAGAEVRSLFRRSVQRKEGENSWERRKKLRTPPTPRKHA